MGLADHHWGLFNNNEDINTAVKDHVAVVHRLEEYGGSYVMEKDVHI